MKLKLTLNVNYKPNGMSQKGLESLLRASVLHLVNNGLLTGETPAEVNEWSFKIEKQK